jgi:hypothetical protein
MAATTWVFELRSDGETRRGAGGQAGKVWVRTIGGLMPVKIVALGGFLVSTIDPVLPRGRNGRPVSESMKWK